MKQRCGPKNKTCMQGDNSGWDRVRALESIGRALPGREMIVVSRGTPELPDGVHLSASVREGIERARDYGEDELFIAGGASIYAATLPLCDRVYLTRVAAEIDGDVLFPETDFSEWRELQREQLGADENNQYPTTYVVYDRTAPS